MDKRQEMAADYVYPASAGLEDALIISGEGLTIRELAQVARKKKKVSLSDAPQVRERIRASHEFIRRAVAENRPVYGVTTAFGGMSDVSVPGEEAEALQNNIPWPHKTGAGNRLAERDIRAAMLLRINSLMRGVSGVRPIIMERLRDFLNAGITPHVYEMGSIGASGDLVPLSYIAGSLMGLDNAFRVRLDGEDMGCIKALEKTGLSPFRLAPKEGLAIINGTSVMTGIAANCIHDMRSLLALVLGVQGFFIQGLGGTNQSFHAFIHRQKPHPGLVWTSEQMLRILRGSRLILDEPGGDTRCRAEGLIQDRYSLRCLPQYFGPIMDGFHTISRQVETEMNSASDNPLIDAENNASFHCGNFLGQYIGMGMDQLRYHIGLLAKHTDVQIALLVAPEFSNGLPPSLVGNPERKVNLGLKGLQLSGNSVMPLLLFYGNSLADRFPTHAEQFNQNINSQGFGSANLARQSVGIFRQYISIALIFGMQALDLRTKIVSGHYDARSCLSPSSLRLYESILEVVGKQPSADRPYVWNDDEQSLDFHIRAIADDIAQEGKIPAAVKDIRDSIEKGTV
ncbi:MAG: aromatic amino acid ammonia-lyase [Desulfococcaceae bacterium]|jgi:phenylalanine ammonia-lyase|nr:aromatic amino acid ammonia-lyase [Desulfococcaceae bacterium]